MRLINPSAMRILFPWAVWKLNTAEKKICLTFDDGPHPEYTPRVINILNDSGIQGLFFCNGEQILRHPGVVQKLHQDGHAIGNHGLTHERMTFKSRTFVMDSLVRTNEIIEQITHNTPRYFRPPYGKFDMRFNKWMRQLDMRLMIWSLMTWDFQETDRNTFIEKILKYLHPGAILVFHDGHKNTPFLIQTLPDVITTLKKRGYRCVLPGQT